MPQSIKIVEENLSIKKIALQYLLHEFSKLLGSISDAGFWEKFSDGLNQKIESMKDADFWQLVSGVSEGYKLKWIYRILSDDSFSWNKELWNLGDITMTSMDPKIDEIIKKNDYNPIKFGQYAQRHREVKELFFDLYGELGYFRNKFPILLRQDGDKYKVLDGMRRTCLAATEGKKEVEVIVGHKVRDGKMKVNPDKIYFLNLLYKESSQQKILEEPLKVILKEINNQFSNLKEIGNSGSAREIKSLINP